MTGPDGVTTTAQDSVTVRAPNTDVVAVDWNAAIMKALDSGDAATVEKIVAVAERVHDRTAAMEFASLLAEFQEAVPIIRKTKPVREASHKGGNVLYHFAPLPEIQRVVRPLLTARGFSYRWNQRILDNGQMVVTCVLSHANGHSESSDFATPIGKGTSIMSGPQKHGGTNTFAQRYSLLAVLGLTVDEDTDASEPPGEPVSEKQAADLLDLFESVAEAYDKPEALKSRLFAHLQIASFEEVPAAKFHYVKAQIESKRKTS